MKNNNIQLSLFVDAAFEINQKGEQINPALRQITKRKSGQKNCPYLMENGECKINTIYRNSEDKEILIAPDTAKCNEECIYYIKTKR